jgi:polysaccharide export outer membrane protein
MRPLLSVIMAAALLAAAAAPAAAQAAAPAATAAPAAVVPPPEYVIGPEDVLGVVVWREADLSTDVVVRPDGKISLPLLNEIQAAGLTPAQLREEIETEARRFVTDATATVIVRQINSRRVFITGQVAKPGPYPIGGPTTVLQLIAMAGGLTEFADQEHIIIWRASLGHQISYAFDYRAVSRRRNLRQNILLQPGDTIVVP